MNIEQCPDSGKLIPNGPVVNGGESKMTSKTNEQEPVRNEAEYAAGYEAFMRLCAYYAMAHAEGNSDVPWRQFHNARIDHKPETDDYVEGWDTARERMIRECCICFGLFATPRAETQDNKENDLDKFNTVIPLPGEPGYAEYEENCKARNAAFKAK
jgi:hypothetical protein